MREPDLNGARYVCVYNQTRERFVATQAKVADSYFTRLVGLLGTGRSWPRPGRGLWIVPSHGVHTIGMAYALDLIFLDRNHVVVELRRISVPFVFRSSALKPTVCWSFPRIPSLARRLAWETNWK